MQTLQELNETAHKILDVAEHYTQTRGFNAFSYKDIQREVGIKTSSIHYYFPTKQDLALSMTVRYNEHFKALLQQEAQANQQGLDRLTALGAIYSQALGSGKFCLCGMLASDLLALPDNVSGKLREFFAMLEGWIAEAMMLAQTQGQIAPSVKIEDAAAHFLSALEGGMLIARTQQQQGYFEKVVNEAVGQLQHRH